YLTRVVFQAVPGAQLLITKKACDRCRARKVRCNLNHANICSNCTVRGYECTFLNEPKRRGRKKKPTSQDHPSHSSASVINSNFTSSPEYLLHGKPEFSSFKMTFSPVAEASILRQPYDLSIPHFRDLER
ncbi:Glucose-responsive transcription factor, partial [Massospora cicadina]